MKVLSEVTQLERELQMETEELFSDEVKKMELPEFEIFKKAFIHYYSLRAKCGPEAGSVRDYYAESRYFTEEVFNNICDARGQTLAVQAEKLGRAFGRLFAIFRYEIANPTYSYHIKDDSRIHFKMLCEKIVEILDQMGHRGKKRFFVHQLQLLQRNRPFQGRLSPFQEAILDGAIRTFS